MPPNFARREYSTEVKERVIGMCLAGSKQTIIAETLGVPKSSVNDIWQRFLKRGTSENAPRPGRPSLTTKRDERQLVNTIKKDRRASLADITNKWNANVSMSTTRRVLHGLELNSRKAQKKPFLNDRHIAQRLAWALERKNWSLEEWKRVIWTDEASFELGKNSREIRVWRKSDEVWNADCLAPTFKSGRVSLMVWGCMVHGRLGPLVILPVGKMNGEKYVQLILDEPLWEFYSDIMEERGSALLMEDGAPIHRCILAKKWRELNGITTLEWPAQSPDLNPIENVWKLLKDAVSTHNPPIRTIEDLRNALNKEWTKLDIGIIRKVVENMPQRIKDVIQAQGRSTRY